MLPKLLLPIPVNRRSILPWEASTFLSQLHGHISLTGVPAVDLARIRHILQIFARLAFLRLEEKREFPASVRDAK